DVTHPNRREQIQAVGQTLDELSITEKPVITALNKIDLLPTEEAQALDLAEYPNAVTLSAANKQGIDDFLAKIQQILGETQDRVQLQVRIPYEAGELVQLFHQRGLVEHEEFGPEGTEMRGTMPRRYAAAFERYALTPVR
ncbi:MAG TPA: GTPase HflX, partial [Chloroflexota bacterium]|nr:GTPase HflX [Chloroflexota bacterium]